MCVQWDPTAMGHFTGLERIGNTFNDRCLCEIKNCASRHWFQRHKKQHWCLCGEPSLGIWHSRQFAEAIFQDLMWILLYCINYCAPFSRGSRDPSLFLSVHTVTSLGPAIKSKEAGSRVIKRGSQFSRCRSLNHQSLAKNCAGTNCAKCASSRSSYLTAIGRQGQRFTQTESSVSIYIVTTVPSAGVSQTTSICSSQPF